MRLVTLAAQAAGIPCNPDSIREIVGLCDLNNDGSIDWPEFCNWMAHEVAAGCVPLTMTLSPVCALCGPTHQRR